MMRGASSGPEDAAGASTVQPLGSLRAVSDARRVAWFRPPSSWRELCTDESCLEGMRVVALNED